MVQTGRGQRSAIVCIHVTATHLVKTSAVPRILLDVARSSYYKVTYYCYVVNVRGFVLPFSASISSKRRSRSELELARATATSKRKQSRAISATNPE